MKHLFLLIIIAISLFSCDKPEVEIDGLLQSSTPDTIEITGGATSTSKTSKVASKATITVIGDQDFAFTETLPNGEQYDIYDVIVIENEEVVSSTTYYIDGAESLVVHPWVNGKDMGHTIFELGTYNITFN